MKFETTNEELSYSKEEIEQIEPSNKKEYYRMLIKEILEKNPRGISVARISGLTNIGKKTVTGHLEFLVAVREAYKMEYGPKSVAYYPNGRLAHPIFEEPVEIGGRFYTFRVMESDFGTFVHVQEKAETDGLVSTNILTTVGGIVIHKSGLKAFIDQLERIQEEI